MRAMRGDLLVISPLVTLVVITMFRSRHILSQFLAQSQKNKYWPIHFTGTPISQSSHIHKFLNRSSRVEIKDEDRIQISFVHVGKTGGSTISLMLRNGCHSFVKKPCPNKVIPNETIASFKIEQYYHVTPIPYNNISTFVVAIRNPIHRVISAFLYQHPKNVRDRVIKYKKMANENTTGFQGIVARPRRKTFLLYSQCFPTLRDFVLSANGQNETYTIRCPEKISIAQNALLGKEERMEHLYRNYKHYIGSIPVSAEVFVIRKEHLYNDWIKLNSIFQNQHEQNLLNEINYTDIHSVHYDTEIKIRNEANAPLPNDLVPYEIQMLCPYLQEELKLYISLLNRAVNLSDKDVLASLQDLNETCPIFFSNPPDFM